MKKQFTERILKHLEQPGYTPIKPRKLAENMGIARKEYGDFHDAVDALRRVGRVVLGSNNAVMLPRSPQRVTGTYRANPRGFGFVVPDTPTVHGDIFIAAGKSMDAVTGDKVLCRVMKRGQRDGKMRFGGRIIKVIERGNSQFVGRLRKDGKVWYVMPDGNMLHVPILIGDPHAKSAQAGDQVVVEITRYPRESKNARGVIVERLGKSNAPGVDLLSIIREHHLPADFPENVLRETRNTVHSFDMDAAMANREDLTSRMIITIDPEDARDFDDAISLSRIDEANGTAWELGVHIADVSTFVPAGNLLDKEAVKRGTSIYLPGRVIPMLPEVLSNGLCSLQEDEPRLCKSVFMRYDKDGQVTGSRCSNSVIRSRKRLTYREATSILDGKTRGFSDEVTTLLKDTEELARTIQARRLRDGMIVLDIPSVHLLLDADGRVVGAEPEDQSFSHTLIEMFMVEANEAVARLLEDLQVPCLRRIHPDPDQDFLRAMSRFLRSTGFSPDKKLTTGGLQTLLENLRGQPQGYAVNLTILKSMESAEYSPRQIGHFALASKAYTYFTSPIRRYPDLMIHRLLNLYLAGELLPRKKRKKLKEGLPSEVITGKDLEEIGKQMSFLSRRAESAEYELKDLKVLTLLQGHLGEVFDGVVTGITHFGLFVQHPKYLIDGLIRFEDLGDDWWNTDLKKGRVTGERTNTTFTLGSEIKVQIAGIDISARKMDLRKAPAG